MGLLPKIHYRTAHSDYVVDQNNGTYTRTRREIEASDLSEWGVEDGLEREYQEMRIVGDRLFITHPDDTFVCSTVIQSREVVE